MINNKKWILGAMAGIAVLAVVGCGSSNEETPSGGTTGTTPNSASTSMEIGGAGSTFVNPAMSKWVYAYQEKNPGITINYQSVGSGAGIAQYKAGTVDFGATDAPLSDKELAEMPTPTAHIPITVGCAVLAYNLEGIESGLKLTEDVVADIFLGKIKTWDDPRIAKENPGLKLPAQAITVAHRSDGSGTTFVFTDYLSSVSPEWKNGPGTGKSVNWPVGVGGKGSEGIAGLVKQTPGGIGYVELAYALQTKLTYATLRNKSGAYVAPSVQSTSAAANAALDAIKSDIRASIVNSPGKDAYPIVGFTYVLVSKAPKDAAKAKAMADFLEWALGPGQEMAAELQYGPLPSSVTDLNKKVLEEVRAAAK